MPSCCLPKTPFKASTSCSGVECRIEVFGLLYRVHRFLPLNDPLFLVDGVEIGQSVVITRVERILCGKPKQTIGSPRSFAGSNYVAVPRF
jgi:hypothetical protein